MARTFNWTEIGPKLIATLEDIDWALNSGQPDAAEKIVERVFKEIGHDDLDAESTDENLNRSG